MNEAIMERDAREMIKIVQEEPETLQQVQLAYMKGVKTGLALPRPKEEEESDGPSEITATSVRR